jgi:hypothetical protein
MQSAIYSLSITTGHLFQSAIYSLSITTGHLFQSAIYSLSITTGHLFQSAIYSLSITTGHLFQSAILHHNDSFQNDIITTVMMSSISLFLHPKYGTQCRELGAI